MPLRHAGKTSLLVGAGYSVYDYLVTSIFISKMLLTRDSKVFLFDSQKNRTLWKAALKGAAATGLSYIALKTAGKLFGVK